MKNSDNLILLDKNDNILVARQEILQGESIFILGEEIEMHETVNLGFKLALKEIAAGEKIIKFGIPIGRATAKIMIGETVHVHNIKSDYSPTYTIQNQREYEGK